MADLKYKFCGRKFQPGMSCMHSATKKHVAITDGRNCVYCGKKFQAGFSCIHSPSKKHQLDH